MYAGRAEVREGYSPCGEGRETTIPDDGERFLLCRSGMGINADSRPLRRKTDLKKGKKRMKKIVSYLALSALLLFLLVWGVVAGTDWYVLSRWDAKDSSVIVIEDLLGKRADPASGEGGEWESEFVKLRILYRSGPRTGLREDVEIMQLADSRLTLLPGKEYLLLADMFEDGTVQFSVSDRYRVPAVVGFITFACGILVIIAGRSGFKALVGLFSVAPVPHRVVCAPDSLGTSACSIRDSCCGRRFRGNLLFRRQETGTSPHPCFWGSWGRRRCFPYRMGHGLPVAAHRT